MTVWPQNQILLNRYVEVFVLQMCCKCAAILLQIFGMLIFKLFHHIQYLLFCLHAKFHSSKAKTHVNSDFIAHHRQNVLNSRKYQKIRFLSYFHGFALMGHGVHKYFQFFLADLKIFSTSMKIEAVLMSKWGGKRNTDSKWVWQMCDNWFCQRLKFQKIPEIH